MLASAAPTDGNPLILNRVTVRLRIDPDKQRIDVEQGEIGNMELGIALSGSLDYSAGEPRLDGGRRRHPHVGCGDETDVAGLRRAQGARLGREHMLSAARSSGW